jgi:hypothetical protein
MSKNILPDQHYIDQIRKRLWCGKECGKVAVMIGAGFSLNANKITQNSSRFLLWPELVREMKSDLYPYENIEINTATSESLKLASEYELVFGRQALDELILRALPDQNYVPGELHKLLLTLPWSDVYTTNYDTLLERTRIHIHDRKYDLVLTSADLPTTSKPRIVKLHGSFPSNRPFIITEEDYRTYPKKFSAFINTVQQSIMENALCLIGFSGDDPNFLNWIGWVRDNLGIDTPPIYFCGFINQSLKRILESRRIVPIDLSPLFNDEIFPGGQKYSKALEWFLLNLRLGKAFDIMKWPQLQLKSLKIVKEGLPEIPIVEYKSIDDYYIARKIGAEVSNSEVLGFIKKWSEARKAYPGWIIAPKSKRERIWATTESNYYEIMRSIGHLSIEERLDVFYELNWRHEISLMPLMDDLATNIENIISQINPFENIVIVGDEKLTIKEYENKYKAKLDMVSIRTKWVELYFAIARHAREEQNAVKFMEHINRLWSVVEQNIEWKVKWYHEKCLFNLAIFNQSEIMSILNEWPTTNDLPFWEVKRAAILAEIGELREARRISEEALNRIRLMVRTNQVDITSLSQEGWAMILLNALKLNVLEGGGNEYRDRWSILGSYGCNPWQELDTIGAILKSSVPRYDEDNRVSREFDRGRITKHFSFGKTIKEEIKLSYAFLRIFENAAIPFQCEHTNMFGKEAAKAAKWIKIYSPFWSISTLIRCNEEKELKGSITRLGIATLSEDEVRQYYEIFIPALEQAVDKEPLKGYSHVFYTRQIQSLSEMVSRLCIRFSKEQIDSVLKVALKMYRSTKLQRDERLNKYIETILYRVFLTMTNSHKVEWLAEILRLDAQMEEEYKLNPQNSRVDIFSYFSFDNGYCLPEKYNIQTLKEYISNNLNLLANVNIDIRGRSLLRLTTLYGIKALTLEEEERFAQLIWHCINEETGMPYFAKLYNYSYLNLPSPKDKNIKEIMLNFLRKQDIPCVYQIITNPEGKASISYSGGDTFRKYLFEWIKSTDALFMDSSKEISFIEIDNNEAVNLFSKLYKWWQDQKEILLDKSRINIFGDNDEHIEYLISFLSIVIILNLNKDEKDLIDKIEEMINEIEAHGYEVLFTIPFTLKLGLHSEDEAKDKLLEGLFSADEVSVRTSVEAIVYWIWYGERNIIPQMPRILFEELINRVVWRKQPEVILVIKFLNRILEKMPQYVDERTIEKICFALDYLLLETDIQLSNRDKYTGDLVDITEQRLIAAKLAWLTYILMQKRGKEISESLKKWEHAAKIDPLAEVRNIWAE